MAIPNVKSFSTNSRNTKAINPVNLFGNLSQTNYYQVNFSGFSSLKALGEHIKAFAGGVDLKFAESDMGLLCSEATLPGSSLATAEVKDNFMGISQEYAHTRLYTDIDFTFYIDKNFNTLKFFEGWIDFIASGSEMNTAEGLLTGYYYRRMHYPDEYKCSTMSITKFEKDFEIGGSRMHYLFINAFPKLVTAVPVSYGGADILRVSVSFNYDRYIVNPPSGQYERQKLHDFKLNRNAETNMRELQKNPAPTPVDRGGNTSGNYKNKPIVLDPVGDQRAPSLLSNEQQAQELQESGSTGYSRNSAYQILLNRNKGNEAKAKEEYYKMFPDDAPVTTQQMVDRDNRVYGNTVPEGSFGITKKNSSMTSGLSGFND